MILVLATIVFIGFSL